MIKIEFSWAIALYMSLTAVALIAYWFIFERVGDLPNRSISERNVWQCSICTFFYIDSKNSEISTCPRCGSYNKKQVSVPEKEVKR